ncbi:NADH dehydrogenase (Ubiquinone) complex I, assembly factor 6 [Pleurostoma richardsiae]|uniref:NADH dehydrogenase (Ubiquinone) complex I, assembly factor 6 n=1 Tax=Pleurostoma richardsiae TaxID=41990 RepID=A0AA38RWM8_9PEZI|nr:NADH dehydrogenase (Ubiquinone) complex I, assembly factor 6 [Pleurostoma richardsiae]
MASSADVEQARKYCVNQLRQGDYESYLIRQFIPSSARDAYDALRTLNLELARLPEVVSSPAIGRFRVQFWRDSLNSVFQDPSSSAPPPREPISILLHAAVRDLVARTGRGSRGAASSIRFWAQRLVSTREAHLDDRPFVSLAALETYAENTYATLMYATLAALPLRSMHADHLASHIGKACGIAAVLRGIPVLSAPRAPVRTPMGGDATGSRNPALLLPLDVMADVGLREEDVFRRGPEAPGLQDAVFKVATRAHDHLITAREMLKNLKAGRNPGHDFEHEGEEEHVYDAEGGGWSEDATAADIKRAFGVFLEAVPAEDYLARLEAADFDPFKVKGSWKLPWKIWQALRKQEI